MAPPDVLTFCAGAGRTLLDWDRFRIGFPGQPSGSPRRGSASGAATPPPLPAPHQHRETVGPRRLHDPAVSAGCQQAAPDDSAAARGMHLRRAMVTVVSFQGRQRRRGRLTMRSWRSPRLLVVTLRSAEPFGSTKRRLGHRLPPTPGARKTPANAGSLRLARASPKNPSSPHRTQLACLPGDRAGSPTVRQADGPPPAQQ